MLTFAMSPIRATPLALILTFAASSVHAASPFDGRWVDDLQTQMGEAGYDTYVVTNQTYKCESCRPARSYPPDGKMRAVAGDTSVLSEAVRIRGSRAIVTRVLDHEMERETTMTVAPDGKTATYVSLDRWPGRAARLRTEYVAKRVAPAPPGSYPVSGSWLGLRYLKVPEEYRSIHLSEVDGQFTRSNFRHGHYTARIGGPSVPVSGDGKNVYKATVVAPDALTRVETVILNGKPVVERTFRLSDDGRAMVTTVHDPNGGNDFSVTSHREPRIILRQRDHHVA